MLSFRRNPERSFKLFAAVSVVTFYLIFSIYFDPPKPVIRATKVPSQNVQYQGWRGEKSRVDTVKAGRVKDAMRHAFRGYKENAWGSDDIDPVTGKSNNNGYGWAAFMVESSTTLALMGMWEDFSLCVEHLLQSDKMDFGRPTELVEPHNATSSYLGSLVSLLELGEADLIPESAMSLEQRNALIEKAVKLGKGLQVAFETNTGIPFPRVDFHALEGRPKPSIAKEEDEYVVEPCQVGGVFLENAGLTRLTGDTRYHMHAVHAWSSLVFNRFIEPLPGLISGPVDVFTAQPHGSQRHWDTDHVEYYDSLVKAAIWAPTDRLTAEYKRRWLQAASAVRHNLTSRSQPSDNHFRQHLFLGKWEGQWYLNEMSQAACAAPATLLVGGTYFNRTDFVVLGKAVLEACHHVYASSSTKLGPEKWSWRPMSSVYPNGTYTPESSRSLREIDQSGFWIVDSRFLMRPAYFASLFYAWRITGEERYRIWAWDAFKAIERHCKINFGFTGLTDVMETSSQGLDVNRFSGSQGTLAIQTLRWLWLTFSDTDVLNLDHWVLSAAGHAFRRA